MKARCSFAPDDIVTVGPLGTTVVLATETPDDGRRAFVFPPRDARRIARALLKAADKADEQ